MAMTLRLPTLTGHRLRLTSAFTGRSANEIVTEAVERWLDEHQPAEVTALLSQPKSTPAHPEASS